MSEEDKAKHRSEYQSLLAIFINFLKNIHSNEREEILYELAELRTELAFKYACSGFHIDEEEALQLLRNVDDNSLSKMDKDRRDRIIAAVNNIIEFAVCEEYQVAKKADEIYDASVEEDPDYDIDFNNPEDEDRYLKLCALYNDTYAIVENGDIEYAMGVAYSWIRTAEEEYLTYWTMNDAKVRPWHMELQGYTSKKDDFPSWMIPPIEWNCRCYLETISGEQLMGSLKDLCRVMDKVPQKPSQIDNVFSESVAKCGRIFGKSHPYFSVDASDKDLLNNFVERLKIKYYGR